MLATVCGVGNNMGHAHGRTCKVKSPAKAMLVIFHYIVWQHYFYFVFLCGFLWLFKGIFDMETLLACLKGSKRWVARTKAVHTPMWTDPSTQQLSLWRLPGFTQPGRAGGGRWGWPEHRSQCSLSMWLKSSQDPQSWLFPSSTKFSELPKSM